MFSRTSYLLSSLLFTASVAAYAAGGRCGTQHPGSFCDADQGCCSVDGYCGITDAYCLVANQCQANCTDGTPVLPPPSLSSASATATPSPQPQGGLSQTSIIIIAVVCAVVVLVLICGALFFIYKRRKSLDDRKFQGDLLDRTQAHDINMADRNITRSQLELLSIHGRDILAIMPGGTRPGGSGPDGTGIPGPGRVIGAV